MKYIALSVALLLVGLGLTRLHFAQPEVVPVVRLRTGDGFFVTLVRRGAEDPQGCAADVERLRRSLEHACGDCYVDSSACAGHLTGLEAALARGDRLPVYTVSSPGLRMAILGPPGAVPGWCEAVAGQLVAQGVRRVSCRAPLGASARGQQR